MEEEALPGETEQKTEPAPPGRPERGSSAGEPKASGRAGRVLARLVLVLLAAFVGVQVAGVLLRDRLERRKPLLAHAPPTQEVKGPEEGAAAEKPAVSEPSRFGPEIREVVVAGPGAPAPGAEAPPVEPPKAAGPAKPAEKEPPAKPAPKDVPVPAPAKTAQEKPAPRPAAKTPPPEKPRPQEASSPQKPQGTHVLLVDVFLSQKYLRESEQRLKKLGVPSTRTEFSRKGKGFKIQVSGSTEADRDKAKKAMEAGGYLHRAGPEGVEAHVFYRQEAQTLAEALTKQGLQPTVTAVEGERPYWRLYAGPFSEEDAKKAQQRLAAAGVKTTLELRP